MALLATYVIYGEPASKKNSKNISFRGGRIFVRNSRRYEKRAQGKKSEKPLNENHSAPTNFRRTTYAKHPPPLTLNDVNDAILRSARFLTRAAVSRPITLLDEQPEVWRKKMARAVWCVVAEVKSLRPCQQKKETRTQFS